MVRCQVCKAREAVYSWQPFGPDDNARAAFTTLGSHYRGFPAIKTCLVCHDEIQAGIPQRFIYRSVEFEYRDGDIERAS